MRKGKAMTRWTFTLSMQPHGYGKAYAVRGTRHNTRRAAQNAAYRARMRHENENVGKWAGERSYVRSVAVHHAK